MEDTQLRILSKIAENFCDAIRSRTTDLRVQLDVSKSRMRGDLMVKADNYMTRLEHVPKFLLNELEGLNAKLESLTATEDDVEKLFDEVDSLTAISQAKKLQLTILCDHIKALQLQLRLKREHF